MMETYEEIEAKILNQGGEAKRAFLKKKEGFIANVIESNLIAGKKVDRMYAYGIWKYKFMKQYNEENKSE